jgi:hypothetical protein
MKDLMLFLANASSSTVGAERTVLAAAQLKPVRLQLRCCTSCTCSATMLIKSFGSKLATGDAKDNCSKLD